MSFSHQRQTLCVSDLSLGYQTKDREHLLLSDLNFSVGTGDFICLLGSNGTGKSTLIRTLAGIQAPIAGTLELAGKPFSRISPRERARLVSIVFTDNLPIGMMDGYTFASLGRHPYSGWMGRLSEEDHACIDRALESVSAQMLKTRLLSEMSDGERQKISIARALAQEAQLMLLDEPTAFLDLPRRVELMRLMRNLCHRKKIGMLLSTHDLDLALRYADHLWLITPEGELIQGLPEELALNGKLEHAFASENLDWDTNSGSFHTHRNHSLFVTLEGEGPVALWTRRAFERLGLGITRNPARATFSTTIEQTDNTAKWKIRHNDETYHFDSINQLIVWIRSHESKIRYNEA